MLGGISCAILGMAVAQGADIVAVPGGEIRVEVTRESARLDPTALIAWVRNAANAVVGYYGSFPVAELRLLVTPKPGRGVSGGRTWADDGGLIRIRVGEASTPEDYENDWVLVHEMTHLALPSLSDEHEWLEEGLATYIEPLARAQAGQLSAEAVWDGYVRGMPNGLPQPGDRGLDDTQSWGRTYWGGALFCLLADLEIRRRTENRLGLQHALRAILAAGNMEKSAEIGSLLEIGDRAVGVLVLSDLYLRQRNRPEQTDLDAIWQRLGIERDGESVRFEEEAPDAAIRRAMTAPPIASP